MKAIQAIFQDGAFWPIDPVELPKASRVELEPRILSEGKQVPSLDEVYEVLNRRFHSGEGDIAERHNEHQP
jgi:predicted DNA-binding antitoxin AbrB/MazE fold protein